MTAFFCKKCCWLSVLLLGPIYTAVLVGATNAKADTNPAAAQSKLELKPLMNNFSAPGPDYLGHLGGLKVRIPRNNIFIIEYDGEPNWLDPEKK